MFSVATSNQSEPEALFVNDLQALASQLNDMILEAKKKGLRVDLNIQTVWRTEENYMRERIKLTVWREVS